jgi:hypothetical protein
MNGLKHPDAGELDLHVQIRTPEAALVWAEKCVALVKDARVKSVFAGTVDEQRSAYAVFLLRQGSAKGIIMALMRTGFLTPAQYDALNKQILALNTGV